MQLADTGTDLQETDIAAVLGTDEEAEALLLEAVVDMKTMADTLIPLQEEAVMEATVEGIRAEVVDEAATEADTLRRLP